MSALPTINPAGAVTLTADEAAFLAARFRRLLKHFGYHESARIVSDDSLIHMAGAYLGGVLLMLPSENRATCEVGRDAAKCWRHPCADAKQCTAPTGTASVAPREDCPHAAPFRYCDGCKVSPCPIGME